MERAALRQSPTAGGEIILNGNPHPVRAMLASSNPLSNLSDQKTAGKTVQALDLIAPMDFYPNAWHIDDEMASYDITFYNAFSETSLGGNTVAIILDAGGIEARQMASIANKLNAPATAFVTGLDDTAVDVRFFSVSHEYPMCGFGIIGLITSLVDQTTFNLDNEQPLQWKLRTPTSTVAVTSTRRADGKVVVMTTLPPAQLETRSPNLQSLAGALGIEVSGFDEVLPIEAAHSDFVNLLVPVKDKSVMQTMSANMETIKELCSDLGIDTLVVFTADTEEPNRTVHCREFCPAIGIPESAATGTTNRALACYLVNNGQVELSSDERCTVVAEQGYEMGRPSLITTEVMARDGEITTLRVGGTATKLIQGTFTFS